LNDTIDLLDLTEITREFHPPTTQYMFFLAAHGTFSKIDYILGHKGNHNKYKKIEITSYILYDHSSLKLEFSNKRNSRKHSKNWKLNNTLLHDQWVIKEIRETNKTFLKTAKMPHH
jgi:hypothetical protein